MLLLCMPVIIINTFGTTTYFSLEFNPKKFSFLGIERESGVRSLFSIILGELLVHSGSVWQLNLRKN